MSSLNDHPGAKNRNIVFLKREKNASDNQENYEKILKYVSNQSNSKLGILLKDSKSEA